VPFDIRPIWYQVAYENRETRQKKGDPNTVCVTDKGDAQSLRPPQFQRYNPGSQQPDKAPLFDSYGNMPELLRLGLLDPRLRFLQEPNAEASENDPLSTQIGRSPCSTSGCSGR
jgi:hypothetical protein